MPASAWFVQRQWRRTAGKVANRPETTLSGDITVKEAEDQDNFIGRNVRSKHGSPFTNPLLISELTEIEIGTLFAYQTPSKIKHSSSTPVPNKTNPDWGHGPWERSNTCLGVRTI